MADLQFQYHFSNAFDCDKLSGGGPTFLRHHGIKGQLRILNALESNIDKVKLVLKGTLTNVVCHRCDMVHKQGDFGFQRTVVQLEDVQDSVSSRYNPDHGNGESFPFDFRLPRHDQDSKQPHTLPSSLAVTGNFCAFSLPQDPCLAETRVSYFVETTVYRDEIKIATATKEIRILDCSDAHPPPVHLAHFPYEYTCSAEKTLKRLRLYGTHRLAVSVAEPKPVEVCRNQGVVFAAFPVRFTVPLDSKNPKAPPKSLTIRVKSQLLSFSFLSVTPMTGQPTIGEAKLSPLLAVIPKSYRSYHRKMLVEWGSGSTNTLEARKGTWQHDTTMLLPICEGTLPTPTFFTLYLARRYNVALRFDVQSDGKASFHLTIPLQIVYPADSRRGTPSYETVIGQDQYDAGEAHRLPSYVR